MTNTQQFFKGLAMTLISIVVTFFSQTPIDFLLMGVTAVCTILVYTGKNLVELFHSDSPAGSLSIINLVSALLVAIGTGALEAVGLYLIDGVINWQILGKVVLSVTFTYLGGTFFAGPYSTEKKRFFASKSYIRSLRKVATIIVAVMAFGTLSAQGPLDGFFKPKSGMAVSEIRAEGDQSIDWYIRPAAGLSAIKFDWDKENKVFNPSTFSAAGIGLGAQHYVERNGVLVNNYGVNALLMLDASTEKGGMAVAGTINALQFVNLGAGYNFTGKQFFILTGAVYNF